MPTTKTNRAWSRPNQRRGKSASPLSASSGNPVKNPGNTLQADKNDKPYLAAVKTPVVTTVSEDDDDSDKPTTFQDLLSPQMGTGGTTSLKTAPDPTHLPKVTPPKLEARVTTINSNTSIPKKEATKPTSRQSNFPSKSTGVHPKPSLQVSFGSKTPDAPPDLDDDPSSSDSDFSEEEESPPLLPPHNTPSLRSHQRTASTVDTHTLDGHQSLQQRFERVPFEAPSSISEVADPVVEDSDLVALLDDSGFTASIGDPPSRPPRVAGRSHATSVHLPREIVEERDPGSYPSVWESPHTFDDSSVPSILVAPRWNPNTRFYAWWLLYCLRLKKDFLQALRTRASVHNCITFLDFFQGPILVILQAFGTEGSARYWHPLMKSYMSASFLSTFGYKARNPSPHLLHPMQDDGANIAFFRSFPEMVSAFHEFRAFRRAHLGTVRAQFTKAFYKIHEEENDLLTVLQDTRRTSAHSHQLKYEWEQPLAYQPGHPDSRSSYYLNPDFHAAIKTASAPRGQAPATPSIHPPPVLNPRLSTGFGSPPPGNPQPGTWHPVYGRIPADFNPFQARVHRISATSPAVFPSSSQQPPGHSGGFGGGGGRDNPGGPPGAPSGGASSTHPFRYRGGGGGGFGPPDDDPTDPDDSVGSRGDGDGSHKYNKPRRITLPHRKDIWDGKRSTFDAVYNLVLIHLRANVLGYIVDKPELINHYLTFKDPQLTYDTYKHYIGQYQESYFRFTEDIKAIHIILSFVFGQDGSLGYAACLEHSDGIELLDRLPSLLDADDDIMLIEYQQRILTQFDPKSSTLDEYLRMLQSTYQHMARRGTIRDEKYKYDCLIQTLGDNWEYLNQVDTDSVRRDPQPFTKAIQILRRRSQRANLARIQADRRKTGQAPTVANRDTLIAALHTSVDHDDASVDKDLRLELPATTPLFHAYTTQVLGENVRISKDNWIPFVNAIERAFYLLGKKQSNDANRSTSSSQHPSPTQDKKTVKFDQPLQRTPPTGRTPGSTSQATPPPTGPVTRDSLGQQYAKAKTVSTDVTDDAVFHSLGRDADSIRDTLLRIAQQGDDSPHAAQDFFANGRACHVSVAPFYTNPYLDRSMYFEGDVFYPCLSHQEDVDIPPLASPPATKCMTTTTTLDTTDELTVRCDTHLEARCHALSLNPDRYFSTPDSGADTGVVGKGWRLVGGDSGRRATVTGFDSAARKKGLVMGTHDAIARTLDGRDVILRYHNSVGNPSGDLTLLSQIQVQLAGHIVDTCPKHLTANPQGLLGTQSLYLRRNPQVASDGSFVQIPLQLRAGLMTFEHRYPLDDDYDRNLEILELSLSTPWNPTDYYDQDHVLSLPVHALSAASTMDSPFVDLPPADPDDADLDAYHDALASLPDRLVFGKKFSLTLEQHLGVAPVTCRRAHIDTFIANLSYDELLGFIPACASRDSFVFAVREVSTFRDVASSASALIYDDDVFVNASQVCYWEDTHEHGRDTDLSGATDLRCCASHAEEVTPLPYSEAFAAWSRVRRQLSEKDLAKLQPYFAWIPIQGIQKTLENTTQLAKAVTNYPMVRHMAARFKLLNRFRLNEIVAMDTVFARVMALFGFTCVQVFYGLTSHCIDVYGMKSKSEVPKVYRDFIREKGVPSGLHRDGAMEQKSNEIIQLNREFEVKDSWSEPRYPNQNPVEALAIKWLKKAAERLLNHTGAPEIVWVFAFLYLALVNNWTADPTLRWITPHEKRYGTTPDISALLCYHFYEPIYYLDVEAPFPHSREKAGYWLGVAHNVGDALTFYVLSDDTQEVLARSVVRSRRNNVDVNHRVHTDPNLDPGVILDPDNQNLKTPFQLDLSTNEQEARPEPKFRKRKPSSLPRTRKHKNQQPSTAPDHWEVKAILNHASKLTKNSHKYKGEPWSLQVDWEGNWEPTWEPLSTLLEDVPQMVFNYLRDQDLLEDSYLQSLLLKSPDIRSLEPRWCATHANQVPSVEPAALFPDNDTDDDVSDDESLFMFHEEKEDPSPTETKDNGTANVEPSYLTPDPKTANQVTSIRRSSRIKKSNTTQDNSVFKASLVRCFAAMAWGVGTLSLFMSHAGFGLPTVPAPNHLHDLPLDQDVHFRALHHDEVQLLHDLQLMDSFNDDRDPHWHVTKILSHRASRLRRRRPASFSKDHVINDKTILLKAQFVDGHTSWVPASVLRLANPAPLISYVTQHDHLGKPYFHWVSALSTSKSESLIKAFNARMSKAPKYKFGVQLPHSPKHALLLDRLNGNNLWGDAMQTEMNQLEDYQTFRHPRPGEDMSEYQYIPYHMVFDVKFDGRRKARLVANGNKTLATHDDVYSGVVSIETVRLLLTLGAQRKLLVQVGDIGNAFLYSDNKEKTVIKAGPEFGPHRNGRTLIVAGSWYGHRTAAAAFHEHLAANLRKLGFTPSRMDHDLWMRKRDGQYEYLASYVDDIIVVSHDPPTVMEQIKDTYILKGVGQPDYYLGGDVINISDPDMTAKDIWHALGAQTYIENSLSKFDKLLTEGTGELKTYKTPMLDHYHPEVDLSSHLDEHDATRYRSIIGSLNWIVTLGRFDIMYATNTLARFNIAPREGHLIAAKRVLGYLKKYPQGRLLIHPQPLPMGPINDRFKEFTSWQEFYPDAQEEIPDDRPPPLGSPVQLTLFVDADHAHCELTRRSITGIVVFVNSTPVKWYSKMQNTVETSTYGSELVAARIATEIALEYRYNIRMLGYDVDGPTTILGDNNAVILNTTVPSSQLKKKHNAIAYHRVREMIACRAIRFVHIPSELNLADVLTKPLGGIVHHRLITNVFFGGGIPSLFVTGEDASASN